MNRFIIAGMLCLSATAWSAEKPLQGVEISASDIVEFETEAMGFGIEGQQQGMQMPDACKQINLTEDQKLAIHTAMFAAKREAIQLQANLKIAGMDYLHNIADSAGTAEQADKLSGDLTTAISAMAKNKLDFHNNVFFKILKPEQRHAALVCEMEMKKHMMEKHMMEMCHAHAGHGSHGGGQSGHAGSGSSEQGH